MPGWFEECISTLIKMNANIGDNYKHEALIKELGERITQEGDYYVQKIHYHSEMDLCDPSNNNISKCILFYPLKEDKIVPKEFYFEPPSRSAPYGNHYVDVFYKKCQFRGRYACAKCYFNLRFVSLLERINHAAVEIILEMANSSTKQTFSFIGIRTITSANENNEFVDKFLTFKFSPKSGNAKETKNEEKTYVISCLKNRLEFVEIRKIDDIYFLVQEDTLDIIDSDKPELGLIDINDIFFINDNLDVSPVRDEFLNNIQSAFDLGFLQTTFNFSSIKDLKIKPKPEMKKTEIPESKGIFLFIKDFFFSFKFHDGKNSFAVKTLKVVFCVLAALLIVLIIREASKNRNIRPKTKSVNIL